MLYYYKVIISQRLRVKRSHFSILDRVLYPLRQPKFVVT